MHGSYRPAGIVASMASMLVVRTGSSVFCPYHWCVCVYVCDRYGRGDARVQHRGQPHPASIFLDFLQAFPSFAHERSWCILRELALPTSLLAMVKVVHTDLEMQGLHKGMLLPICRGIK